MTGCGTSWPWAFSRPVRLALVMMALALVAACGNEEEEISDAPDAEILATQEMAIYDASPTTAADLPQDADTATIAIRDGKLDPDQIQGRVGQPFILTVQGDGQAHTFEIEQVVAETEIKAEGETLVNFTVPEGDTEDAKILLDGEEAGTLRIVRPGGVD